MVHSWSNFMYSSVGICIWLRGWGTSVPWLRLPKGVRTGGRWAGRGRRGAATGVSFTGCGSWPRPGFAFHLSVCEKVSRKKQKALVVARPAGFKSPRRPCFLLAPAPGPAALPTGTWVPRGGTGGHRASSGHLLLPSSLGLLGPRLGFQGL